MSKFKKQYKIGDTIWIKELNGEIHSGLLMGINILGNLDEFSYLIYVNDEELNYVHNKIDRPYFKLFKTIYSEQEIKREIEIKFAI